MSVFLDLSRMNRLHWAVAARTTCIFCPYLIGIVLAGFQSRDGLSWLCRAVKRSVEQKIIPGCPTHRVPLDSGCILGCRRCDIFRHRRRLYLSSDSAWWICAWTARIDCTYLVRIICVGPESSDGLWSSAYTIASAIKYHIITCRSGCGIPADCRCIMRWTCMHICRCRRRTHQCHHRSAWCVGAWSTGVVCSQPVVVSCSFCQPWYTFRGSCYFIGRPIKFQIIIIRPAHSLPAHRHCIFRGCRIDARGHWRCWRQCGHTVFCAISTRAVSIVATHCIGMTGIRRQSRNTFWSPCRSVSFSVKHYIVARCPAHRWPTHSHAVFCGGCFRWGRGFWCCFCAFGRAWCTGSSRIFGAHFEGMTGVWRESAHFMWISCCTVFFSICIYFIACRTRWAVPAKICRIFICNCLHTGRWFRSCLGCFLWTVLTSAIRIFWTYFIWIFGICT